MDDALDDALDVFDIGIAEQTYELIDVAPADVPTKITIEEILEAQKTDSFCQTVLERQSIRIDSAFFEGPDGLLRRHHPREAVVEQIVLPDTLRPRVLQLAHHAKLAGHLRQTRMYYILLAPHGSRHLRNGAELHDVCKESFKTEEADEPPQAIPGNEATRVRVYRYTRAVDEIEEMERLPSRDHGSLHKAYARRTVAEDHCV